MATRAYTDHLNNKIEIPSPPKRIISLVPSQTELLFDLGLTEEIAGRTKFCIHPKDAVKQIPTVGGTKVFNFSKIRSINPDLIIANKEENYKEGIEGLQKDFPVWISDIYDLSSCCDMIRSVGALVGKEEKGVEIAEKMRQDLSTFHPPEKYNVAYLIWKDPYMSIGSDTFIHQMLKLSGFKNVFADKNRYPVISAEEIHERQPELIFLSSEPYPFKEKHLEEFKKISPSSKIILVDGELFSWHGSRLLHSADYFHALHQSIKYY